MNLTKKKFFVFALGICLLLTVLFLSLPANSQEQQDVATIRAEQESVSENSLPADLKQMVAFKTSAGGDLKIYLMCDDSVLVSFLEPADPDRAEALSRIDSSDLIALYQTLTGRSDVPGDVVRMHDIITANRERQKLQPRAGHQEYPIIYPVPDESAQNVSGYYIAGTPSPGGYSDNKWTVTSFKATFCQLDPAYNMTCYYNYREPIYQEYLCLNHDNGTSLRSYIYVNWVKNLTDYVIQHVDRKYDGKWHVMQSAKVTLGILSGMSYFDCPNEVRLQVDNPFRDSFHTSFRTKWWPK